MFPTAKTGHLTMLPAFALAAFALACAATLASPQGAQALSCNTTAYNRAVKAAKNYKKLPQTYTVNVADLHLSRAQVNKVVAKMHINGELFWVNTQSVDTTATTMTFTQTYTDAQVTKMRKKVTKAVKKAKKRLKKGMSKATKVHMLHDWFIKRMKSYPSASYRASKGWACKNAYAALVTRKADCFGYARGFDLLLRRCGFKTDIALQETIDHSWNLVKVSGKWYHVDTTWDDAYSYKYAWKHEICHAYLLQSDKVMKLDTHGSGSGWTCSHKCKSNKFRYKKQVGGYFAKHCNDWKHWKKKR